MEITGLYGIEPDWFNAMTEAFQLAREAGFNLKSFDGKTVVMEGNPYIWEGEPRMSRWTFDVPDRV